MMMNEYKQRLKVHKRFLDNRWPDMSLAQQLDNFGRHIYQGAYLCGKTITEKPDFWIVEIHFTGARQNPNTRLIYN